MDGVGIKRSLAGMKTCESWSTLGLNSREDLHFYCFPKTKRKIIFPVESQKNTDKQLIVQQSSAIL